MNIDGGGVKKFGIDFKEFINEKVDPRIVNSFVD
jgi:hypothetical protein